MNVDIGGIVISPDRQQVIGSGGEGTVFRAQVQGQDVAVKLYHTPTPQRQQKLQEMTARQWQLPPRKIAFPYQLARDADSGAVLGLVMPYFGAPIAEIGRLANKKRRASERLTTRQVVSIFLDGAATLTCIHRNGLVVGDLNDQNILYRAQEMLWIDVDAWQFATYVCPVACEDYLDPELYGVDLASRPHFTPEHDWYAFAIHLFRSLLLVHPYGGTHPGATLITQRAAQRLFVLQEPVIYPKFAFAPDLISDDLLAVFERYFARGWRGSFPLQQLEAYADTLVECHVCRADYPRTRAHCPHCQTRARMLIQPLQTSKSGVSVREMICAEGQIVFCSVYGTTLYALAYEQGNAVLYRKALAGQATRTVLFKELPGANYAMVGTTLIVNPPGSKQLLCLDVSQDEPRALCQSASAIFSGSRSTMFQGTATHLYSILNAALIASTIGENGLSSRPIRSVMEEHTWFRAASVNGTPTLLGYFQIYHQQLFWLQHGSSSYELDLAPLSQEETLLDLAVYFGSQDVLVRRHIQARGVDYLLTHILDYRGRVMHSLPRIKRTEHPCPRLHGLVYANGTLLHAGEQGIMQERVVQGSFKTFSATAPYVQEHTALELYQDGLLIINDHQILYMQL